MVDEVEEGDEVALSGEGEDQEVVDVAGRRHQA